MRPSRGYCMGIEWQPLELNTKDDDKIDTFIPNIQTLGVSPEELHKVFFEQAQHLQETIDNQNLLIEFSGMNPEKHNENLKAISIESIANEFNGNISDRRLQLPFKGISKENVNIEYSRVESNWAIKLSINTPELDQNQIIRTFLLPKSTNKLEGNWSTNNLIITF